MTEQKNNLIIKTQTQNRRSTALSSELSHCDSISSEIGTLRNLSKLIKTEQFNALCSQFINASQKKKILYSIQQSLLSSLQSQKEDKKILLKNVSYYITNISIDKTNEHINQFNHRNIT